MFSNATGMPEDQAFAGREPLQRECTVGLIVGMNQLEKKTAEKLNRFKTQQAGAGFVDESEAAAEAEYSKNVRTGVHNPRKIVRRPVVFGNLQMSSPSPIRGRLSYQKGAMSTMLMREFRLV